MLGRYDNFPLNIHFLESFSSTLHSRQLQQKLIQTLYGMNGKSFSFEEIAIPTIPDSEVIFEFGIADGDGFNFLDEQETIKTLSMLKEESVQTLDFFCSIRYYKFTQQKKTALMFDYYMFKTGFSSKTLEFQVFHRQGPRYISPEDLVTIITEKINRALTKRALNKIEPENEEF
jgi:hypothetical protein